MSADEAGAKGASAASARLVLPALIVAVAAISFAAPFFRKAAPTHPLAAAAIRLAVAALLLAPLVVRARLRGTLTGRLAGHATLAGLAYAVHFGSWVTSLGLTTVAASVTIVTATPLLLGLWALGTGRDRPERRHWIAIALALAGLSTIGGHDWSLGGRALLGDALAGLGAAAMACYLLLGRRLSARREPAGAPGSGTVPVAPPEMDVWAFSGIATAVGSVSLFAFGAARGLPLGPASSEALVYLVLAALLPQLVGHSLLTWSLRHARPTVVGIATIGEPVGATALGWLWLGERVPPVVAAGCAVVLAAVVVALREPRARLAAADQAGGAGGGPPGIGPGGPPG